MNTLEPEMGPMPTTTHPNIEGQFDAIVAGIGLEADGTHPEVTAEQASQFRNIGKAALTRAGLEVLGAGVDSVLLMGAGSGIGALNSVVAREAIATTGDIALLNKLQGGEEQEVNPSESRSKRIMKKVGNLALGVTTAIVAQKVGVALADNLNPDLANSGIGEYAVPIASKVGAIAGVNRAQRRFSR